MNYKICIAYDGTNYGGWQIQPNRLTIQELLEEKLAILLKKPTKVTGSGRTDAGVHAMAQVANFHHEGPLFPKLFLRSMNALLPPDIRILSIDEVEDSFHARFSAKGKAYHYHLSLTPTILPFVRNFRYHPRGKLDIKKMTEAAPLFIGKHDFTSFANVGSSSENPIKTLRRLDLVQEGDDLILQFEGDGFLYKMVRNIVGALIQVGRGKLEPEEIKQILAAKDRTRASQAAPPQGLFLFRVEY